MVKLFSKSYYLVGDTAIALQIGHRRSIDFDLFTGNAVQGTKIKKEIHNLGFPFTIIHEKSDQLHITIFNVKMTFFLYPFNITPKVDFQRIIKMPDLLDLAAMKAFAFAQRAKWKDYVDMYFLLKHHFSIKEVSRRTEQLFNSENSVVFSEKLFREQLTYFADINYSEQVEFIGDPVPEKEIKLFLEDAATEAF